MKIDKNTINKIAKLSRIKLEEKEADSLIKDLNSILDWVEQLNEVNTEKVEPLSNVSMSKLPLRKDKENTADKSDDVTTSSSDFETEYYEDEVYDPLEPLNRVIFGFNNVADRIVLEPAAKGYRKLPTPVQSGLGNFLGNLRTPLVALNQLLQGQGKNAVESTGRFLVNSTVGVFGIIDVADKIYQFIEKETLNIS